MAKYLIIARYVRRIGEVALVEGDNLDQAKLLKALEKGTRLPHEVSWDAEWEEKREEQDSVTYEVSLLEDGSVVMEQLRPLVLTPEELETFLEDRDDSSLDAEKQQMLSIINQSCINQSWYGSSWQLTASSQHDRGKTAYRQEAVRALRYLVTAMETPHWTDDHDWTYNFWAIGLKYVVELFGQYEGPDNEEADTLGLSSAVKDLIIALDEHRQSEKDRKDEDRKVRTEARISFDYALDDVINQLSSHTLGFRMGEDEPNAIQGSTELNMENQITRLTAAQLVANPLVPKESEIPWAVLRSPSDLREWIGNDDKRWDKAWLDYENEVANKWLITAVDPGHACYFSPEDLRNKKYSVDEDHWGDGVADDIKEWVLRCFSDYTGLKGQIQPLCESIDFDLDEAGRISDISSFVILASVPEASLTTTWFATFDDFNTENEDGWWVEFDYLEK